MLMQLGISTMEHKYSSSMVSEAWGMQVSLFAQWVIGSVETLPAWLTYIWGGTVDQFMSLYNVSLQTFPLYLYTWKCSICLPSFLHVITCVQVPPINIHPHRNKKVSDPSFQAQDKIMQLYFRTWVINRAVLVLEQYAYKFISQKFGQMQPMCLQLYTLQPCHEYLTASNFGPSDS